MVWGQLFFFFLFFSFRIGPSRLGAFYAVRKQYTTIYMLHYMLLYMPFRLDRGRSLGPHRATGAGWHGCPPEKARVRGFRVPWPARGPDDLPGSTRGGAKHAVPRKMGYLGQRQAVDVLETAKKPPGARSRVHRDRQAVRPREEGQDPERADVRGRDGEGRSSQAVREVRISGRKKRKKPREKNFSKSRVRVGGPTLTQAGGAPPGHASPGQISPPGLGPPPREDTPGAARADGRAQVPSGAQSPRHGPGEDLARGISPRAEELVGALGPPAGYSPGVSLGPRPHAAKSPRQGGHTHPDTMAGALSPSRASPGAFPPGAPVDLQVGASRAPRVACRPAATAKSASG